MRTVVLLTVFSTVAASAWLAPPAWQLPNSLKGYCDTLAAAKAVQVHVTVQEVPGATEELSVVLAREGKYFVDSPSHLTVSDGKTVTFLDKKANTYTQRPVGDTVLADLNSEVSTWVLMPFFEKESAKLFSSGTKKGSRKVAGTESDEVAVVTPEGDQGSIYIAKGSGIATGFQLTREGKSYVVLLKEAKLDGEDVADSQFAFVAPEGATKEAEATEEMGAPGWATVSPIFKKSCMPCHGEQKADGIDLRTYSSTMASKTVVPGNAASSRLVKSLRGQIQPRMPQGRPPLPEATIKVVEKWISAGAKQ